MKFDQRLRKLEGGKGSELRHLSDSELVARIRAIGASLENNEHHALFERLADISQMKLSGRPVSTEDDDWDGEFVAALHGSLRS